MCQCRIDSNVMLDFYAIDSDLGGIQRQQNDGKGYSINATHCGDENGSVHILSSRSLISFMKTCNYYSI